ncbi:unnamed protein product [Owenia fusiformis]|uniref:Uncharacterized protein n=1 Tax=Owenia fusiformis TaxID=6347 RepID=A0A8J1U2C4_OWEFU|nr:unnamed protein product [Owenia fusiformis]
MIQSIQYMFKRIIMEYKMKLVMILLITTATLSTLETTEASVRDVYDDDILHTTSYQMPLEIEDEIINHDAISKTNASVEKNIPDFCQCGNTDCVCIAPANVTQPWTLHQLLETLPNNISLLSLSGFTFGLLKNETFRDFSNLRRLFISNCSVFAIEVDTFKSFQNMDNVGLDLGMNNITNIVPGTFSHARSWSFLSFNKNYNLGRDNVQNILHDLENKRVNSLSVVACGIVIETLDKSFYEALIMSGLDRLQMHGNTIRTISKDAFEPVKSSLTVLSISNFMYVAEDAFNILTKLKFLKLGGMQASSLLLKMTLDLNKLQYLTQLRLNMFSLQPVNLEIGNLTTLRLLRLIYANSNFDGYRGQVIRLLDTSSDLKSVDFSGNLLFQYPEEELCQLVSGRSNLTSLSLTDNYISKLPLCTFRGLYKLRILLLKKNRLVSIQKDLFKDLYSLKHLDISQNAIIFIDASNVEQMTALSRLYLRENAFDCNCDLRPFRDWLSQTEKSKRRKILVNYQGEMCFKPLARKHEFVHNFTIPWIECNSGFIMITSLVTIGSILFCATITVVLLKHFWKDILYKKMVYKARKHIGYSPIQDVPIEHDAFVSYHSEKQLWIERDLCTQLEDGEDIKFNLMFDNRMNLGESIFTSMGQAIHTSRNILFVASRGWVAAAMNQLEVDMALLKMVDDHRDMIIVLLMEHIPKAEMSEKLRMIMKHNTCFKWSDNERQQARFWRDLKLELGKHHMD